MDPAERTLSQLQRAETMAASKQLRRSARSPPAPRSRCVSALAWRREAGSAVSSEVSLCPPPLHGENGVTAKPTKETRNRNYGDKTSGVIFTGG